MNKYQKKKENKASEWHNLFDKKVFIVSLLLWLCLNFSGIQNLFFLRVERKIIVIMKLFHFFFLYFLLTIGRYVWKNRKEENVKHGIIIFFSYLAIFLTLLLFLWPGTWSWDDINVLRWCQYYTINPWQHFITSVIQILFLQTLPFATGVIIMQILLISMILGYCISKVSSFVTKEKKKRIILEIILGIPALLPPVLLYIFSGFRMGLYSFVELLLVVYLFVMYKEKKQTTFSMVILAVLTILVASWRTEAIYYVPCVSILLILMWGGVRMEKNSLKRIGVFFAICLVATLGIGKFNNRMIGNDNYSITAIIEPLQELVKHADIEKDKEELKLIDKVIDIQMIYDNPDAKGGSYFWSGIVRKEYSHQDYKNLMKAYIKLALKYPMTAFKPMSEMFYNTIGFGINADGKTLQFGLTEKTLSLFDNSTSFAKSWNKVKTKFKYPISYRLRDKTIRIISGIDEEGKVNLCYYIFRNFAIPFILIGICLLYQLSKKRWFYSFLIITVIARIPLVFATSTSPYFMYYLSVYLISYFICFLWIVSSLLNRKKKQSFENNKKKAF